MPLTQDIPSICLFRKSILQFPDNRIQVLSKAGTNMDSTTVSGWITLQCCRPYTYPRILQYWYIINIPVFGTYKYTFSTCSIKIMATILCKNGKYKRFLSTHNVLQQIKMVPSPNQTAILLFCTW